MDILADMCTIDIVWCLWAGALAGLAVRWVYRRWWRPVWIGTGTVCGYSTTIRATFTDGNGNPPEIEGITWRRA